MAAPYAYMLCSCPAGSPKTAELTRRHLPFRQATVLDVPVFACLACGGVTQIPQQSAALIGAALAAQYREEF
jgi:hypothetical protein